MSVALANVAVLISKPNGRKKPIIWIDSGIHACEWVSMATNQYFIHQLLTKYAENSQVQNFVDQIEWHILPVVNPDGYEYSHTHVGASNDPCSDTYAGATPDSEVETRNIRDYILPIAKDIKAFITIHSYTQLWLIPWGYTTGLPSDYDDLYDLAMRATSALTAVHGTRYQVGTASNILYESTGTSRDWAKGVAKIKYVYTVELRDTGYYNYELPENQIEPTCEETWEAMNVVAKQIISEFA
ncbi:PREDICTED: carboxypeptidase B-like [Priapulus caudatus]|uniref:Carboxypeptidase B-like n=1 Tax=Priapulus caudatus TaxID=37621 RepID=A0ABM1E4W7_PRICU|nr:PREDICTED: carboxypeptidase B-like [Priapulus caudatus]